MSKFTNLVYDQHKELILLTDEEAFPSDEWLAVQIIPPNKTGRWFVGYPVCGGTVNVQEGEYYVIRPVNEQDVKFACRNANTTAAETILATFANTIP